MFGAMNDRPRLTQREIEVFDAVCRHGGNQRAAVALDISEQTVKNTMSFIYRKMGTVSLGQTARTVYRRAILDDLEAKVLAVGDTPSGQEGWMALAAVVGIIAKERKEG
jgi:DNA-binding CsgD family transcriptional regulator